MNTPQSTCPLCHRPNRCDATGTCGRCWCFDVPVPAALLAQLPEDQRNSACICRECIVAFTTAKKRLGSGNSSQITGLP